MGILPHLLRRVQGFASSTSPAERVEGPRKILHNTIAHLLGQGAAPSAGYTAAEEGSVFDNSGCSALCHRFERGFGNAVSD